MTINTELFTGMWDTTYMAFNKKNNDVEIVEETLDVFPSENSIPNELTGVIYHADGSTDLIRGKVDQFNVWKGRYETSSKGQRFALMVEKNMLIGSYRLGEGDKNQSTGLAGTKQSDYSSDSSFTRRAA